MLAGIKKFGENTLKKAKKIGSDNAVCIGVGATGAIGTGGLIVTGMGAETFTTALSLAALVPTSTVLVPAAAVGLICFGVGYLYQNYRDHTSAQKIPSGYEKKFKKIEKCFNDETQPLVLKNYEPEYFNLVIDLIRKKTQQDEPLKLKKVIIEPRTIADLKQLMRAGLNKIAISYLEFIDTTLGDNLVDEIHAQVVRGRFKKLESLVLRNNGISHNALQPLSEIGRVLNLKTLDISNNSLNSHLLESNLKPFSNFIKTFHRNFPSVKRLSIVGVNNTRNSMDCLLALFKAPGLLEYVNFSQNEIGYKDIIKLLNSNEFQYNLNIREVITGSNKMEKVAAAINLRKQRISNLRHVLGETRRKPIAVTTKVLQVLNSEQPLHHSVIEIFGNNDSSDQNAILSVGDKWKFLADKFKQFRIASLQGREDDLEDVQEQNNLENEENIAKHYIDFRKNEDSDHDFFIKRTAKKLVDTHPGVSTDLSFELPGIVTQLDNVKVVNKLAEAFEALGEREDTELPIIRKINLKNIGITSVEFSNLLTAGLGGYKTEELSLKNNKIDDENIIEFANQDLTTFSRLKTLDLSGNLLSANCLDALTSFCGKTGIESLDISSNKLYSERNELNVKFKKFISGLCFRVPTLTKLVIDDIGLTEKSLCLLSPLLSNVSLLQEVKAGQVTIKRNTAYENFYRQEAFLNNFTLQSFDVRKNTAKNIRSQVNKRKALQETFEGAFSQEALEKPSLLRLLSKFLNEEQDLLPVSIQQALNYVPTNLEAPLPFSMRNKLELIIKNLKFHRDKAHLCDKNFIFPPEVTIGEFTAYHKGELTEFWGKQIGDNILDDQREIASLLTKYRKVNLSESALYACEMYSFQLGEHNLKIYYVEDDTIRIVDLHTKRQCVISRYSVGFSKDSIKCQIMNGLFLSFETTGNVSLLFDNQLKVYLKGYEVHSNSPLSTSRIAFYGLEAVSNVRLLLNPEIDIQQNSRPILPHYQNHQQAANSSERRLQSSSEQPSSTANEEQNRTMRSVAANG